MKFILSLTCFVIFSNLVISQDAVHLVGSGGLMTGFSSEQVGKYTPTGSFSLGFEADITPLNNDIGLFSQLLATRGQVNHEIEDVRYHLRIDQLEGLLGARLMRKRMSYSLLLGPGVQNVFYKHADKKYGEEVNVFYLQTGTQLLYGMSETFQMGAAVKYSPTNMFKEYAAVAENGDVIDRQGSFNKLLASVLFTYKMY